MSFGHSIIHSPGNHAGEMNEHARVALREELISRPLVKDIMIQIIALNSELEGSYPQRVQEYKQYCSKMPYLRRLAHDLIFGDETPTPADGFISIDDIADIFQCAASDLEDLLEQMHQADLLIRRQEVAIPPPTINGAIGIYFPPNGVSYKVSQIGEGVLAKLRTA